MSATVAEGPPPKKARPSSVEDVVLSQASAAAPAGKGGAAAAGAKVSGRGMLTLEEVSSCTTAAQAARSKQDVPGRRYMLLCCVLPTDSLLAPKLRTVPANSHLR